MGIRIEKNEWGKTGKGEQLYLFRLINLSGAYAEVTNYGASIVSAVVPDKNGSLGNVVLGFPSAQGYLDDNCYLGATIGRYANRISHAAFKLNGKKYDLEANDGVNSNHGGRHGFNARVFGHEITGNKVAFTLLSKDGDAGFPGNLELKVIFEWTEDNQLVIDFDAVCDADTPANFTNHAYFNLAAADQPVWDHCLSISAAVLAEAGTDYIPTGRIVPAGKLVFNKHLIKEKLENTDGNLIGVNSYYVLDDDLMRSDSFGAKLTDIQSGRTLTVATSYPGIFLYTGDYLNSKHLTSYGALCRPFGGLCLECQHYPDSVNRPEFPQAVLSAGQSYHEHITYKFGIL